jgi:hypothetical protein
MQGTTKARLLEIDLHVACGSNLFGPASAIEADADQLIARQHPGSVRGGTFLNALRYDSVLSIDPLDTIPGRGFVSDALTEIEEAGTDQERRTNQQKPGLGCEYRSLHCYLKRRRLTSSARQIRLF